MYVSIGVHFCAFLLRGRTDEVRLSQRTLLRHLAPFFQRSGVFAGVFAGYATASLPSVLTRRRPCVGRQARQAGRQPAQKKQVVPQIHTPKGRRSEGPQLHTKSPTVRRCDCWAPSGPSHRAAARLAAGTGMLRARGTCAAASCWEFTDSRATSPHSSRSPRRLPPTPPARSSRGPETHALHLSAPAWRSASPCAAAGPAVRQARQRRWRRPRPSSQPFAAGCTPQCGLSARHPP